MAIVYGNKVLPTTAQVIPPLPITFPADTQLVDRRLHLGAPNWNMSFDATRGRFGMSRMSWAHMESNEGMTELNPIAGQEIISLNTDSTSANAYIHYARNPLFTKYAQSGVGLVNIKLQNANTGIWELIDYNNQADVAAKFNNSLLHRLGFDYYKLLNKQGSPPIIFQERHWNSTVPRPFASFFPFPTTTNCQFDTSFAKTMDLGSITIGNGATEAATTVTVPFYGLGLQAGHQNANISSESATIYASNLPSKLVFPYWLIRSDIIDGVEFHSQNVGSRDNILAVCSRSYLAGDFAFKMGQDYEFTATKDYVITEINTSILNPDLSPADVEGKTSVIYKIKSPIPLFQIQQENLQKNRRKE
jgi:hypothetical protein